MQESLGLETAEGLKTDERPMLLLKVAFDFLVCSLKKKIKCGFTGLGVWSQGWPLLSSSGKATDHGETLWSGGQTLDRPWCPFVSRPWQISDKTHLLEYWEMDDEPLKCAGVWVEQNMT